jgi:DNA-binding GntR family transcriptional regulator
MQSELKKETTAATGKATLAQVDGPLNEQVYQRLKWALTIGGYAPGDGLSIRSIAAELDISTMPVREALKRLVSERALTSSANRSFRVPELAPKGIADLFFVRSCLEGIATELATPLLTSRQIDRLDELARSMDAAIEQGNHDQYLLQNYTFHFTIYTAAGNAELVSITEGLWAQTGAFLASGVRGVGLTPDWRRMHGDIAEAIRARDSARARALIEQDINWGTKVFGDMDIGTGLASDAVGGRDA